MKKLNVLVIATVVLLVFAGTALAQRVNPVIELTEDQIAIIVHNCPQNGEITIELTEDQIAIIIHNFPQVEITELTLGREHISRENTVELAPEGRTGVAPVSTR